MHSASSASRLKMISARLVLGLFALIVLLVSVSYSHEIRPSIADFNFVGKDTYEVVIQTNAEALLAGIGSEHEDTDQSANVDEYNRLRAMGPDALAARFDEFSDSFLRSVSLQFDDELASGASVSISVPPVGDMKLARESVITISGPLPTNAVNFMWIWPEAYGASVIRMNSPDKPDGEGYSAYLSAGEASEAIALRDAAPRSFIDVAWEYLVIGFTHILPKGLDHILFVVGLFLLSAKLSSLLWQVSAFTLAHTVTLALGILGYVSISPAIVEPLIAASIVYVAVENILTDKLHRWRPVIVFCFGLLHGLGFAGVLEEIGLSSNYFVTGLISFNVGVELGQLAVIAICFGTFGYWFGKKPWYRQVITTPASIGIAIIASWWVFERIFLG
ncbi:MAG: HupE/UreJ family protein [Salaquimonas sp.]